MISSTLIEDFTELSGSPALYRNLQDQRIYITGATGQIGWYLLRFLCFLVAEGKLRCELNAHVRSQQRLIDKFPDHAALPCRFVIDSDAARILETMDCDLLIHCASKASPKHFGKTPVDVMMPNALLTQALLERLRQHNPACRFVYLSTTGVTGFIPDDQRPSTESDFGPLSCTDLGNCYLESKRFGEMLCLAYLRQYAMPVLIIRPSITYGPGFDLDDGRSYADFIGALLKQQPIRLTSDGRAVRNFLYISDFARGLLMAIDRAAPGAIYNIASPFPISILELATLLNEHALPTSLGAVERAPEAHPGMQRVNFNSTDASVKQLQDLGWDARVAPLEGFKRTLRHYQESTE